MLFNNFIIGVWALVACIEALWSQKEPKRAKIGAKMSKITHTAHYLQTSYLVC